MPGPSEESGASSKVAFSLEFKGTSPYQHSILTELKGLQVPLELSILMVEMLKEGEIMNADLILFHRM